MRKYLLLASTAAVSARAFMSDVCEVVNAKVKGSTDPVRVNRDEFEADQLKDAADRTYTGLHKDDDVEQSSAGTPIVAPIGVTVPPAPSAPNFQPPAPAAGAPPAPLPGAPAVPVHPAPNALLVSKEGRKFYAVDVNGVKVVDREGIENDGYATEELALAAIKSAPGNAFVPA